jgi:hypothetical protein
MDEGRSHTIFDTVQAPSQPCAEQVIEDIVESEADESAGRTYSGADLLAEMDRIALLLKAKNARRQA